MKRALWIHHAADPWRSGDLRRLALPALLVEGGGWISEFRSEAGAGQAGAADLVICSLRAAGALSRTPSRASVLIEADSGCLEAEASLGSALHALSNRIVGVVVRSPRVSQWAERVLAGAGTPIWLVPDTAARDVELNAAALRFGIPNPADAEAAPLPKGEFDLWFSEPGDAIGDDQVDALRLRSSGDRPLVVVAPAEVRIWLRQIGVVFEGIDWSPATLRSAVSSAARCIFHGRSTYAQLRRAMTALRLGGAIFTAEGEVMPQNAPSDVGRAWLDILKTCTGAGEHEGPPGAALVFADLIQDIDLILPLVDGLTARRCDVRVLVSGWLQRRSPRLVQELEQRTIEPEVLSREAIVAGDGPDLSGVGAVITPAESSLPAHARAHTLFQRARMATIPTFSMQHGVENVGLSDADPEFQDAILLSDHLFTWSSSSTTLQASPALKPRLRAVGRAVAAPSSADDLRGALANFRSVVAVFENLHWNRYSRAYRHQFLSDCLEFAAADPERCIVLKPHHAGLWSVRHTHLFPQWPQNLVLADPADSYWEPYTAPSLMALADFVITTPSTVALDAAEAGKPVAVAAYGMSLPAYAPLPLLHSLQDWLSFVSSATAGPATDARRRAAFLVRTAWGEHPVQDMIDHVCGVMAERAWARERFRDERSRLEGS